MVEMTKPHRKYSNPPIQEAVCEIHPVLQKPLNREEIDRMGPIWKKDYPHQQTVEEKALRVEIALGKSQTSEEIVGHKLFAKSEDGKNIVQLASSLFAVNRLPPYGGWEETFRDIILQRFNEAHSLLGFRAISRINLRYINRIELPEATLIWKQWFTTSLPIPSVLPGEPLFFQSHTQLPLKDGLLANINFGILPGAKIPTVMLDIDVVWQGDVPIGELPSMLDKVHSPHNLIFESYLTDNLRTVFKPI